MHRNGTKGHHCLRSKEQLIFFARFLNSTCGQGPFPLAFAFSSSSFFSSSFCFCLNAYLHPSPCLASWAASGASSCHLCSPTCYLLPLPPANFFIYNLYYLFIFGCTGSSLLRGLFCSLLSSYGVWASHCSGFSCCGAQALGTQSSVVAACGLQYS